MRIRMPKSILSNLEAEKGKTLFDIYYNADEKTLVLKPKVIKGEKITK